MDPTQYLFFVNTISAFSNASLQPQRTIDYELGFKQKVSNTAAFTISAFYREFKDQVEITKIINAYPKDYLTYGNIDFGTTKGFSLDFDMRRTGNISIKANYTLQFADGTGSDPSTQLNIVQANQSNFVNIAPLDYDSRHLVNINVNYSYGSGKDYNGPVIKNSQIFSDAGIGLSFNARSGTPYTAQQNVTAEGFRLTSPEKPVSVGSINGSRMPFYYRLNLRVWKDFNFMVGKKNEKKEDKRAVSLEIYLEIQNLLNTKNVVSVYRYTGTPNTDGYLSSPASVSVIQAALNPQAFKDQYTAIINTVPISSANQTPVNGSFASNYALPRRIYLGGIFSF
jgi:outer membrane receptor protein involved in Fe transport